jgi:hypothetical protein
MLEQAAGAGGDLFLMNTSNGSTTLVGSSKCFFAGSAVSDDGALWQP